jgi:hypothetical protein
VNFINRLLLWTEDHFIKILVTATVISGVVAAYQRSTEAPTEWQPWGFVWGSFMVVKELMGSRDIGSVSALDICSKLFKVTIAAGALKVYFHVAGVRLDDLRARLRAGHVVIVGEHDFATAMAISLRHCGARVTLEADSRSTVDEGSLRRADVVVIRPKSNALQGLQRCRVDKATMLLALQRDFSENIALCKRALALARKSGNDGLSCLCRIDDIKLKQFTSLDDFFDAADLPHIRLVNEAEVVARQLLDDFPPDSGMPAGANIRAHVLLIGLGSIGQSVLLFLAQIGHYRGGEKPRVTVIDPKGNQQYNGLVHRFPAIPDLLDVQICAEAIEFGTDNWLDGVLGDVVPVSVAYACTHSEVVNLVAAKRLIRWKKAQSIGDMPKNSGAGVRIVVVAPPGSALIDEFNPDRVRTDGIAVVPLLAKSANVKRVLEYAKDDIARAFHAEYARVYPHTPNAVPWEQLEEYLRDSNRLMAAHVDVKMRAIGCEIVDMDRKGDGEVGGDFHFFPQELADLQRIEHARWLAERRLAGWRHGPQTDKLRGIHSSLVPFDSLPESESQKARLMIESIPRILANTGRRIRRPTN